VPAPPYFSIQLGTAPDRARALALMKKHVNERHIRAELRKSGWQIRVGVYLQRTDAEAARDAFAARGTTDARVLAMQTAVPWLLPDGRTLPVAVAKPQPRAAPAVVPAPPAAAATEAPVLIPAPARPPPPPVATKLKLPDEYRAAAVKLDEELRRLLRTDGLQRRDGFLYGRDVAPMLLYAAQRQDQTLYLQLLPLARRLIIEDPADPFARGFVLWRRKPGAPLEITGATETLWMARALWAGAGAFNRADDRALALTVMEGYARHAYELAGSWLVRKYFAFDGRTFAGLSAIANYHPDFMADVEQQHPRAEWRGFGERSYAMLERARTPAGLLYPLVQPEVGATYPDLNVTLYAPNGYASLADSCFAAAGAVRGNPQLAEDLLDFAQDNDHTAFNGRLFAYFRSDDGEPTGIAELSSEGYACLAGLAAARQDRGAFKEFLPFLMLAMRDITNVPSVQVAPFYDGAQLLLTAYAAGAFNPP